MPALALLTIGVAAGVNNLSCQPHELEQTIHFREQLDSKEYITR